MELWDAYNNKFEKLEGVTLTRGKRIPDGMCHLVCDVIVRHVDGEYLLMQRDTRKHYGGMWEATAGGSALQGEDPESCARRELLEETGIIAGELSKVGHVVDEACHSIYVEYLCVTDWPKDKITLQEGETIAFKWVSRETLISMRKAYLVTERMQLFVEDLKPTENR